MTITLLSELWLSKEPFSVVVVVVVVAVVVLAPLCPTVWSRSCWKWPC